MKTIPEDRMQVLDETESHHLLARLADTIPDGIYIFCSKGEEAVGFRYVSARFCEILDCTAEDLLRDVSVAFSRVHPADVVSLVAAEHHSRRNDLPFQWQGRFLIHGKTRWLRLSSNPVPQTDGSRIWYGVISDITDSKQAEQSLWLLSEISKNAAEGVALIRASDATIQYASPRFENLFGYDPDELLGQPVSILNAPTERSPEETADEINRQLHAVGVWSGEVRSIRKDGTRIWTYANVSTLDHPDFGTSWISFQSDITERKAISASLQEMDTQYRIAVETAVDGFWLVDPQGRLLQVNDAYVRMSGYRRDELLAMAIPDLEAKERPEDTAERIARIIRTGADQFESLHRRKDGSVWPVLISTTHSAAAGGRFYVFITDLSERKQAEEALQLASMVYQNSAEAMLVSDADNRIIAVNPAFEKLTGYRMDEVVGKNPGMFKSGLHDGAFYQAMWHALETEGHWAGELWDKRRDGALYAKSLTINIIRDKDGRVFRYVALFTDITERKKIEELVWRQANFDGLTKLPNRQMFLDRLQQEAKKSQRAGLPLALLLIDLDHFKEVNDTLGHDKGDLLLVEAARRIQHCVRDSDTVARLGGDEFVVILSELDDTASIGRIVDQMITRLNESFTLGEESVFVSASIGISLYPDDTPDIDALFKNADQAMYQAKTAGRNGFCYFTPSMQVEAQNRLRLTNDLRLAIAGDQLRAYYQPIVELATGRIVKAEALLRWQHPRRGMVSPGEFIPLAEESGLIIPIGDWIFLQAARQAAHWRATHDPAFQISVNKSPVQIRRENPLQSSWVDQLEQFGLDGQAITVEITEGLLLNADANSDRKLQEFKAAGLEVSLDDFGTGYSSLSYLKKFPIDYLKIDQSFVRNLGQGTLDLALCEAIIVMAHKLDLKVIAEGIESAAQRDLLLHAGCDYGQGYLFARPAPAEEIEKLLHSRVRPNLS